MPHPENKLMKFSSIENVGKATQPCLLLLRDLPDAKACTALGMLTLVL